MPPERVVVIGVSGCDASLFADGARSALRAADLVVGGRRHLDALAPPGARTMVIGADVGAALDAIEAETGPVVVLSSGDPGFFGMVRPLAARFGGARLEVHPAPSSVATAFGRLGLPWDDAAVVSVHGRDLGAAVDRVARRPKSAVLTSPASPPEAVGRALIDLGVGHRRVTVCSRLGLIDETITVTDLAGLAARSWDPLSVVILLVDEGNSPRKALAWGLSETEFAHRDGMLTKAEVRAVALGKLDLPRAGVLWDVGAGSGSVAVECARLSPGLAVHAIERSPDDAVHIRENSARHAVAVAVTVGSAPEALSCLPDPDRAFVGGGGLGVLDAVLARLRPGGRVVATFAALDRAVAAADRLGSLTQVSVARGRRLPDEGLRLVAENPVFIVWGPSA